MPLTSLRPLVTARFQEVNALMSKVAQMETSSPLQRDSDDVRAMRGLLYVHMYGAFEYAMDQSFIRLAQHISARGVARRHLESALFSVVLDNEFKSLQSVNALEKKLRKRIQTVGCTRDQSHASIADNVLSQNMQSAGSAAIALAFEVYEISESHLVEMTVKNYIDEVVERRHAVAHGRESPVDVGVRKVSELRLRYDALYRQAMYVIDTLNNFCLAKRFVAPRYRRYY